MNCIRKGFYPMKKLFLFLCLSAALLNIGWTSESGGGVVSQQTNVVVTSLETTQVLLSDTNTYLYGVTKLGGVTNNASFDAGGVLSERNVASSQNKILLNNADYISWLTSSGAEVPIGVSSDDYFSSSASLETDGVMVFGNPSTDGSWRIGKNGNNLVIERKESDEWVIKSTVSA